MAEPGADRLHALIIGIDAYEQPAADSAEPGYPPLDGCVHDALSMFDLLASWGVPEHRIDLLLAPRRGPASAASARADRPTHERLLAALHDLLARSRAGDQVWIHYSGHGGRSRSAFESLKGPGAWDEALVPVDIARATAQYVRDLELAWLLAELGAGGRHVTVVLDSCHAGGMRRADAPAVVDPRPRHNAITSLARPMTRALRPREELVESYRVRTLPSARMPALGAAALVAAHGPGTVVLAACAPYQKAFEATLGDRRMGLFTHALHHQLSAHGPGLSYRACFERLRHRVQGSCQGVQTPQLQGDDALAILGGVPGHDAEAVPRVLFAGPRGIHLSVGRVHGVAPGHRLAVVAERDEGRRVIELCVVEASGAESRAEPFGTELSFDDLRALAPGTRAVVTSRGDARVHVGLRRPHDLDDGPPDDRLQAALLRLWSALRRLPSTEILCTEAGGSIELSVDRVGRLRLLDTRRGLALATTPRLTQLDAPRLLELLEHIVRYRRLEELRVASSLTEALRVGFSNGDSSTSSTATSGDPARNISLRVGETARLLVEHLGTAPTTARRAVPVGSLQVAVLSLGADWQIQQLAPCDQDTETLDPGQTLVFPIRARPPLGADRLKVFVTRDPVSYRGLEQPPLRLRTVRSADPRDRLEPVHDWGVVDLDVETRPA